MFLSLDRIIHWQTPPLRIPPKQPRRSTSTPRLSIPITPTTVASHSPTSNIQTPPRASPSSGLPPLACDHCHIPATDVAFLVYVTPSLASFGMVQPYPVQPEGELCNSRHDG
ncbi:hypothetical protein B0T26DRAFT_74967 [Lasiosphaeria miniovina]|uniref:Uncharacterized protein n=1 Tax=Lasiosphaeria miniovina TaxID=1954250 RepID=A0AA40EAL3_9PEZI|nr:uncharacterized protein B0T26DRAFT_74967 [Lasiosphaeria miniovina]KAK0734524.1 hypothetical protein B0T26DRAFT_74967 [Lasiosphaeria miniovina]